MIQESNRVEFKGVLNDKMEKEIVAFLNNQEGGILYIISKARGCHRQDAIQELELLVNQ